MPEFLPAVDLCRSFYADVVAPAVPVPHSAALLGPGSDVLGYDTERSTDHDWGPRCTVLVAAEHVDAVRAAVDAALPPTYRGWPVAIGRDGNPPAPNVPVVTADDLLQAELGLVPGRDGLDVLDWLLVPQQRLLGLTAGAVLADDTCALTRLRDELSWYPDPVWWWLLACQWRRLAQEEPFVQRTAEVGDGTGSRVVAARLVRDCMRLALLLARRYAPYAKWLGTAFAALPDDDGLGDALAGALSAPDAGERERQLGRACTTLAARFLALEPARRPEPSLRPFHDRPALVLDADRFAAAALETVGDPVLRAMPLVGAVDQLLDCTDVLAAPALVARLRPFYEQLASPGKARREPGPRSA